VTNFRETRQWLGPRWLTEGEAALVGYSLDLLKDGATRRLELGHLARYPAAGAMLGQANETAPPDALVALGRDRKVIRGISETAAQYAARLITWLDDRATCGNAFTMMKQLAAYCGPLPSFRTVDCRGNWYSRAADGTETALLKQANWNWDGEEATRWARFWVIIYPNGLWTSRTQEWGTSDPWGTLGHAWGCDITQEQAAALRYIVADWKPAGTRCQNIILAFDPASFDPTAPEPDGTWGHWSKVVGGVRVPSRLSTARYLDGSP
jgi:hypothetical protein